MIEKRIVFIPQRISARAFGHARTRVTQYTRTAGPWAC
jgi:hypothetical protein